MARGLLAGAATGLAISVAGAAGLSLFMGYPPTPDGVLPEPVVADVPLGETQTPEDAGDAGPAPAGDTAPGTAADPGGLAAPGNGDAVPAASDTTPAAVPDVSGESAALTAPDAASGDSTMTAPDVAEPSSANGADAPALGAPSATPEPGPQIATDPVQPPAPEMPQDDIALVAPAPEAAEDMPLVPRSDDPAPETAQTPEAIAAPETSEAAPQADTTAQAPEGETAEEPAPSAADAPEADQPGTEPADTAPAETTTAGPSFATPARPLTEREDAARSTRLPTIGGDASGDAAAPDAEAETEADAADASDAPPFTRFASPVDVPADTPRMAVILIDDGSGPLGPGAIDAFPFPVTFAVDPAAPDATTRMAGYREKGFEVLALVDMPEGARPADLEVTFEAALGALPEALGVMEAPGAALQSSREITEQAASYLQASGHGLVMQGQGLNTATSLAQREGVPAGAVFRDIDGEDQDPGAQRRLLDRAALRARQDGQVIALGRLKADTVSALLLWGLQDRAGALALVPISAVIAPN